MFYGTLAFCPVSNVGGWEITRRGSAPRTPALELRSSKFEIQKRANMNTLAKPKNPKADARADRRGERRIAFRLLTLTTAMGCAFIACQVTAWRALVSQGAYLIENPHSSLF